MRPSGIRTTLTTWDNQCSLLLSRYEMVSKSQIKLIATYLTIFGAHVNIIHCQNDHYEMHIEESLYAPPPIKLC